MDAKASAPIKRAQRAAEEATEQGIIWLDLVPGTKNPADLCTKNLANIGEFREKSGIICGSEPFLYESKDVRAILAGRHTPLLKPKKKAKKKVAAKTAVKKTSKKTKVSKKKKGKRVASRR